MGTFRIEIEFDAHAGDAEEFFDQIDKATTHCDWHVTNVKTSMTPVVNNW